MRCGNNSGTHSLTCAPSAARGAAQRRREYHNTFRTAARGRQRFWCRARTTSPVHQGTLQDQRRSRRPRAAAASSGGGSSSNSRAEATAAPRHRCSSPLWFDSAVVTPGPTRLCIDSGPTRVRAPRMPEPTGHVRGTRVGGMDPAAACGIPRNSADKYTSRCAAAAYTACHVPGSSFTLKLCMMQ